ncbi:MAG: peptidylprolyl isomerase [Alcanivoracaceae bacterium]|nr:peptidylprolyl isomerase [Alcanivoracaceae bacterium]
MITKDKVVQFHYTLSTADGVQIEDSRKGEPMAYLHGHGGIIPGLEKALEGHGAGDHVDATVSPEDGYGERREGMQQRVSAKYLKHAGKLRPGMTVNVNTDDGPRTVTVIKVGLKTVDVDGNHPLAGQTLQFAIDIVDVRDATEDEVSHGHAHGPGGHHH